ncbi:hypothetical protein CDD83_9499 [Cordyceps sp. RAO-2017]|nr:hypothetical protein CDD83_9499 [Cordyceps sp. RAO-2017]
MWFMLPLRLLWSFGKRSPPQDGEYDVYPVYKLDDNMLCRNLSVSYTMRFNDVLDPYLLLDSLTRLLEIGDWRKLGGRLVWKEDGGLEIHVPKPFTADRPGVAFTHEDLGSVSIEQHHLGRQFPKPTDGPSTHPDGELFRSFAARRDLPSTVSGLAERRTPQLSLHITSFADATLVAVCWPHTLMDGT